MARSFRTRPARGSGRLEKPTLGAEVDGRRTFRPSRREAAQLLSRAAGVLDGYDPVVERRRGKVFRATCLTSPDVEELRQLGRVASISPVSNACSWRLGGTLSLRGHGSPPSVRD